LGEKRAAVKMSSPEVERKGDGEKPLPYRRVLIAATAIGVGVVTGLLVDVATGLEMTFTALTALDDFIPKHLRSKEK
jgi:hypothetical protein